MEKILSYKPVYQDDRNEKQQTFLDAILHSIKNPELRFFFYGGAIRGGKTAVSLIAFILLAKKFPNSRWHIIRESMSTHEETTIPSFEKFCPRHSKIVKRYSRKSSNYFVEFANSSTITFSSENIKQDPDLDWMKGLETNGILLEQAEELSELTFEKAMERTGSWYIDPMPPGLILGTFNPTQTWVKERIYDKWQKDELKPPFYFLEALPKDNPFVTDQQWEAWEQLDPVSYARFIEGDWSAFTVKKPFLYCWDDNLIMDVEYQSDLAVYLSFDFNVDPCTCLIWQEGYDWIYYIDEIALNNSDIYEVCDVINTKFPRAHFLVTGDATGRSRSAMVKGRKNYYIIIKEKLGLKDAQFTLPSSNPPIANSRVLCNSILANHGSIYFSAKCKELIKDLKYVEVNEKGDIDTSKNKHRGHLLACFRYSINSFHHDYLLNG